MSESEPLPSFVDTNILVYAAGRDDRRGPIARELVEQLMVAKCFHTSTQVLQELFVTLVRKARTPVGRAKALEQIDWIAESPVVTLDYPAVRAAAELSANSLSFWDALIIVAATRARAKRLYTEDLQDGQVILGVEIVNPFLTAGTL